jgi:hypothetical protein
MWLRFPPLGGPDQAVTLAQHLINVVLAIPDATGDGAIVGTPFSGFAVPS